MANGNDSAIVENGGELNTDDYSDIKLINKTEYDSLKDTEKPLWVRYSPSLQSQAYAQWIAAQNEMVKLFGELGPVFDKLMPFTKGGMTLQPIPLTNLINAIKSVTSIAETMGSVVESIASAPVISVIAEPLRNLFGLVGALGGMIYALYMNPYQFIEPYVSAIKAVDLSNLKEQFNAETTPNLDLYTTKVEEIPIPDPDIKAEIEAAKNQIKNLKPTAEDMLATAEALDEAAKALEGIPETLQAVATMGCSWPFNAALDEFNIKFDQTKLPNVDPNNQAMQWANNVNTLVNKLPAKYIKVSDLEKLKSQEKPQQTPIPPTPDTNEDYLNGINDGYIIGRGGNDGAFLEKTIQQMSYKSDEYIKGMREGWNEGYDDYLKYGNK